MTVTLGIKQCQRTLNPYTHKNAFNTNLLSPDNDRVDMYRCAQTFKMCSIINSKQKHKHRPEKTNIYNIIFISLHWPKGQVELSSKKRTKKSSMNHYQQLKKNENSFADWTWVLHFSKACEYQIWDLYCTCSHWYLHVSEMLLLFRNLMKSFYTRLQGRILQSDAYIPDTKGHLCN